MAASNADNEEGENAKRSMRLRVYPTLQQAGKLGGWLYIAHGFRNQAVAHIQKRRREITRWKLAHPLLAKEWVPEEYRASDMAECSTWLTQELEKARAFACKWFLLKPNPKTLGEQFNGVWSKLSHGERDEVLWLAAQSGVFIEWLLPQRTILDQVVQNLGKTISKAISDRVENKKRKALGLRPKKVANFPKQRKWTYACGVRMQVVAKKNKDYQAGWQAGELIIPKLGRIKIKEGGFTWPETPARMITFSRNTSNEWHATFALEEGEWLSARARKLAKESRVFDPLPIDEETGLPAIEGIDMSLGAMGVSSRHGKLGRERHIKRFAKRLRFQNKSVARKQKGSGRWSKAVRELGKRNTRVANTRKAYNLEKAQKVASRSAIVCVEDLQLSFMLQNRKLASSAYDLGWGQFLQLLEQECAKRGHLLIKAGRFDPTTQKCPTLDCDYKNTQLKNDLSIRTWVCPKCGIQHDRDDAASENIQVMALARHLESSTGAESVPGMHKLHPELAAFIARGGMTALLQVACSERRQVGASSSLGCAVPIKRETSLAPASTRMDRAMQG